MITFESETKLKTTTSAVNSTALALDTGKMWRYLSDGWVSTDAILGETVQIASVDGNQAAFKARVITGSTPGTWYPYYSGSGTGSQGTTGAQGPQGTSGTTGSQGNQGNQGNQGAIGTTGSQGNQGTNTKNVVLGRKMGSSTSFYIPRGYCIMSKKDLNNGYN